MVGVCMTEGVLFDVFDVTDRWMEASVLECDHLHDMIRVSYVGYGVGFA